MGLQSIQSDYTGQTFGPYYGLSPVEVATEAVVIGLSGRFTAMPMTLTQDFTLNALTGSGNFMYFAYPTSLGLCQFLDVDSQFIGGWDGANNNPYDIYGPITLNITTPSGVVVPFYVYRTDYPELGNVHWTTSVAV